VFWKTDEPHGLRFNPLKSCVIPRPIGWISTVSADGVNNLAPYSYFNTVSESPWIVMFSGGKRPEGDPKDSVANVEATGEFVCNMVTEELVQVMNQSSAPYEKDQDEAAIIEIEMEPSEMVKPLRVKASPIHLECKFIDKKVLPTTKPDGGSTICFGEVIGVHIRDEVLNDGVIDVAAIKPVGRLGYLDYAIVDNIVTVPRPKLG